VIYPTERSRALRYGQSEAFWRGVAEGFASERNLLRRWNLHGLAQSDTIAYSWYTVGRYVSEALADVGCTYERETDGIDDATPS
jgi:hypothetical protein